MSSIDEATVKTSAEQDLDCFRDDIEVARTDEDGTEVFVATGCGRTGRYTVSCTHSRHTEDCTADRVEEESGLEDEPVETEEE